MSPDNHLSCGNDKKNRTNSQESRPTAVMSLNCAAGIDCVAACSPTVLVNGETKFCTSAHWRLGKTIFLSGAYCFCHFSANFRLFYVRNSKQSIHRRPGKSVAVARDDAGSRMVVPAAIFGRYLRCKNYLAGAGDDKDLEHKEKPPLSN